MSQLGCNDANQKAGILLKHFRTKNFSNLTWAIDTALHQVLHKVLTRVTCLKVVVAERQLQPWQHWLQPAQQPLDAMSLTGDYVADLHT